MSCHIHILSYIGLLVHAFIHTHIHAYAYFHSYAYINIQHILTYFIHARIYSHTWSLLANCIVRCLLFMQIIRIRITTKKITTIITFSTILHHQDERDNTNGSFKMNHMKRVLKPLWPPPHPPPFGTPLHSLSLWLSLIPLYMTFPLIQLDRIICIQ